MSRNTTGGSRSRTSRRSPGAPAGGARAGRGGGSRRSARCAPQLHRDWLELVDTDGPFLSVPVMTRLFPQGVPPLEDARKEVLRRAKPAFDAAWDAWDRARDRQAALPEYRAARDAWVRTVLTEVVGWGGHYTAAADRPALVEAHRVRGDGDSPVVVTPTGALLRGTADAAGTGGGAMTAADAAGAVGMAVGALVLVVDPVASLREVCDDGWATSPVDRMDAMLRAPESTCSIGVVTDGRWWALVSAPRGATTASGVVDAQTWIEEPATRDAFLTLLGVRRLLGGRPEERLPRLFADSVLAAEEITEALGTQVRRAVELVVSAVSRSAADAVRQGRPDPLPADAHQAYEGVVTVMMRVVFLLFAEERGLLPTQDLYRSGYGLSRVLDELDERAREEGEESLDGTYFVWHRLLATSGALFGGATWEDVRMPAYGGSLFDPDRFGFLTATGPDGALMVRVSDRVMLEVLRSVQVAHAGGEAQRVSFRDIDVEQIGYIYEGLLGYSCRRSDQVVLGLDGRNGEEPEVPLAVLEDLAEAHADDADLAAAILAWIKADQPSAQPRTKPALAKALAAGDAMEDAERVLLAVTRDAELRGRLRPWIGAIRRDLRGRPVVILPGELLVVETPSRRDAGAHYTPRSLAEDVVAHALAPLVYKPGPHQSEDRSQWRLIASDAILRLRVADIACGSGAFLVAAARYLARRLVEAWEHEGTTPPDKSPEQVERHALRQVVAHCLYGVDINPMAVEMCKLSLWLVSLDRNLPFSFVDDKVFVGNSLLGITDLEQLRALNIDPAAARKDRLFDLDAAGRMLPELDVDAILAEVTGRRHQLASEVDNDDPARSATTKLRQQSDNEKQLATLTRLADAVIAAGLDPDVAGKPGRRREDAYQRLAAAASAAFPPGGDGDPAGLDVILERGLTPTVTTDYERWRCLHWPLAFPEVFPQAPARGFDAVVGNPPFLGGQRLTGSMGTNMRDWFVHVLADGKRGSADLVAYFFLRAFDLVNPRGTLGLIATNTVAQGDTREVGLDRMVAAGFTITRAVQSRSWPSSSANLEYAAVWGTRAQVSPQVRAVACGERDVPVPRISTLLESAGRVEGKPQRLAKNAGVAFIGCYVLGKGFILEPEEAQAWIAEDPRNAEVLFPYLNGEDLNSRPDCSPSRWVIDFGMREQAEAASYHLPFGRVLSEVKPQRDKVKIDYRREYWWRYAAWAPAMREAIAGLDEVLVLARVSKTVVPVRFPTGAVISDAVVAFATDSYAEQAVLSSSLHQYWAIKYGSGMRNDPRYTPTDVFETFPRPEATPALDAIGRTLDTERREIMLRRGLGLTKLYNLVNDPELAPGQDADVDRMRAIHVELDAAVAAAYGWDDLDLTHGFHTYRQMTRWTIPPATRVEELDRLLEENHRRAAAEAAAKSGRPNKKPTRSANAGSAAPTARTRRGRRPAAGQEEMF
ncbi:Eco57I restriction-modification methylase domain-containing protein [Actinomyces procaprae]|uniref:Eco57I restriction-modification methylase domain-containing protein n=1 Tax=Actinomyces procaprae TaxID=2560010 RepID=UPI001958D569|nr:DNA methyltransferase [Actinomyces procaprae]